MGEIAPEFPPPSLLWGSCIARAAALDEPQQPLRSSERDILMQWT